MPKFVTKSQDLSHFAQKLSTFDKAMGEAQRGMTESMARDVKDSLNSALRQDTGGDNVLSRFNNGKGAKVGATYGIYGYDHAKAVVKTYGPVPILEDGADPHMELPRIATGRTKAARRAAVQKRLEIAYGAKGANSGLKPLLLAGLGIFRWRVDNHPGVAGKGTFTRGARSGLAKAHKQVQTHYDKALMKAFGG